MCDVVDHPWLCVSGLDANLTKWIEEKPVNVEECAKEVTHKFILTSGTRVKGYDNALN